MFRFINCHMTIVFCTIRIFLGADMKRWKILGSVLAFAGCLASGASEAGNVSISGDGYTTYAVTSDGSLYYWGLVESWPATITQNAPSIKTGISSLLAVSKSYALKSDGTIWNIAPGNPAPTLISSFSNITGISSSGESILGLRNDGGVWGHGSNQVGELGIGHSSYSETTAVQSVGIAGVRQVATSEYPAYGVTLAVRQDGTVWAWGYNAFGMFGNGTVSTNGEVSPTPTHMPSLTGFKSVTLGSYHAVGLKSDGTVWAWGANRDQWRTYNGMPSSYLLGNGNDADSYLPVRVPGLTGIVAIQAGHNHTLALRNDGTVWAWGDNIYGQLGNGSLTTPKTPVKVPLTKVIYIGTAVNSSYAIKSDGTVWAWGVNQNGQLGDGTRQDRVLPTQVKGVNGQGYFSAQPTDPNYYFEPSPPTADLSVSATASGDTQSGITYTGTVRNTGPNVADNTSVTISLPAGISYVGGLPATCSATTASVTCTFGNLPVGGSANFTIKGSAAGVGTYSNTVSVESAAVDNAPLNNSVALSTSIAASSGGGSNGGGSSDSGGDGDVPTLPEWGMIILGLLLFGSLAKQNRSQYR